MAIGQAIAYDQFIEFMASLPSYDEIVAYTMSPEAQARIRELLDANHNRRLTDAENIELDEYERLGRLIRRAKIRAYEKMEELKRNAPQSKQ
jgi:hypothetical protein